MPVTNTERAEEVTKHSVHTLVFRSLKRTHDMFISDQGALPALDSKAANLSRQVKARATYGPIMAAVELNKKRQRSAGLDTNTLALTHEGASNTDESILKASDEQAGTGSELSTYQPSGTLGVGGDSGTHNQGNSKVIFMISHDCRKASIFNLY